MQFSSHVINFLKDEYISNIHKVEDLSFLCVSKTNPNNYKKIEVKELSADSNEAYITYNPNKILLSCPYDSYNIYSYHTHGYAYKDQSIEDKKTKNLMEKDGLIQSFCTLGIDGIECNGKHNLHQKWNKIYSTLENHQLISAIQDSDDSFSKIVCTLSNNENNQIDFHCIGILNKDNQIKNLGKFTNILLPNLKIHSNIENNFVQNIITSSQKTNKIKCAQTVNNHESTLLCTSALQYN